MVRDCRRKRYQRRIARFGRFRVFVDGKEVQLVFYIDGRRKFLRTYDVLEDGKAHATCEPDISIHPDWDAPLDGALSKTVRFKKYRLEKMCLS